jgi:hypothetical protein
MSASSGKPYLLQLGSTLLLWFESNGSQRHRGRLLFSADAQRLCELRTGLHAEFGAAHAQPADKRGNRCATPVHEATRGAL